MHDYKIGDIYGMKRIINLYRKDGTLYATTECIKCGHILNIRAHQLLQKNYTSCICQNRTLNGLSKTRLYGVYSNIKDRCYNPNCSAYKNYGAKGVRMCDEWYNDFIAFYEWAQSHGYQKGLSIDRLNSEGPYSPENCEWVTVGENTRRSNIERALTDFPRHRNKNGDYYGIDPDGIFYTFVNANKFSNEHNLEGGCVRAVASGDKKSYKGWKFGFTKDLITEPQSTIEISE